MAFTAMVTTVLKELRLEEPIYQIKLLKNKIREHM